MSSVIPLTNNTSIAAPCEEELNLAIGRRVRRRRRLLGMTQRDLATMLGVQFQQVQKYECATSRISAARLYFLAAALRVPLDYFFGLPPIDVSTGTAQKDRIVAAAADLLGERETRDLLDAYARLSAPVRQRLRAFAKALGEDTIVE